MNRFKFYVIVKLIAFLGMLGAGTYLCTHGQDETGFLLILFAVIAGMRSIGGDI